MAKNLDSYLKPMNKSGRVFYGFLAVLVAVIALGAYALSLQLSQGHTVSGLDDIGSGGASWGIYVATYIYFIGISYAGISVSAVIRLLGKIEYKPIARMGELLSLVSIIMGTLVIMFDLGLPLRGMINIFQYGRIGSPLFFTTSVIVSVYLVSTLVYMYITTRRDASILKSRGLGVGWLNSLLTIGYKDTPKSRQKHNTASRYFSIAILPLLVIANSFSALNIALTVGKPGWYGAIQVPAFLTLAIASGIGAIIIIAAVFRHFYKMQDILKDNIFKGLGAFMGVATLVYLYMLIIEIYVMRYSSTVEEGIIANALLFGEFSTPYWIELLSFAAAFTIIFVMFVRKSYNISGIVIAAVLVTIGAIIARALILIPSQTIGSMLPYVAGVYTPSWVELSVVAAIFALGAFAYALISKVYPLVELPEDAGGEI